LREDTDTPAGLYYDKMLGALREIKSDEDPAVVYDNFLALPRVGTTGAFAPGFTNTSSLAYAIDEQVTHGTVLDTDGDSPFSMSVWFKANLIATDMALLSKISTPLNGYLFRLDAPSGGIEMFLSSDWLGGDYFRIRSTVINWDDNAWHNTVVTYDGSRTLAGLKMYADGAALATFQSGGTTVLAGSTSNPGAIFRHGQSGVTAWNFTGNMDETSWWQKELSLTEIQEIYNVGEPSDLLSHTAETDLVSWWRVDGDAGPTLTDKKGSNHGTMVNMDAGNISSDVP
jgi:hypothetical protein